MAEQDLLNAFNDCVDRMGMGQSIEDCLRRYPQYAAALRPMLDAGRLVQSVRVSPVEVAQVQERGRYRFEEAIRLTAPRRQAHSTIYRLATLAAVLLVFIVLASGASVLSQSSLPGDSFYGLKIITEQIRTIFSPSLAEQFNLERINEVQQLLRAHRAEEVTFRGEFGAVDGINWTIAGLVVQVLPNVGSTVLIHVGDTVEVHGLTTTNSQIIALDITLIDASPFGIPTIAPTHVPTAFPVTARPTLTTTPTITATPPPSPTSTATTQDTSTPTFTPTTTASPTPTTSPSPTLCVPAPPPGWVVYTIQAGDALSHLADERGISLTQLMTVNCLVDAGFIVAGQNLYLPPAPEFIPTQPPSGDNTDNLNDNTNGNSGSGSGNSGNGDNNDNNDNNDNSDDHDSDNSGHGSDDD